jgi:hypothetical protein
MLVLILRGSGGGGFFKEKQAKKVLQKSDHAL